MCVQRLWSVALPGLRTDSSCEPDLFLFIYAYLCVCVPHVCRCSWRPEEGVGPPGAELPAVVRLLRWVLGMEKGHLEEQEAPLTAGLTLPSIPLAWFSHCLLLASGSNFPAELEVRLVLK